MNVNIGKGDKQVKYAVQDTNVSPDPNPADPAKPYDTPAVKKYMSQLAKRFNQMAGGYDMFANMGKPAPTFPTSMEDSLNNLRNYFQSTATGPC